jgi:hypothetical protein
MRNRVDAPHTLIRLPNWRETLWIYRSLRIRDLRIGSQEVDRADG